MLSGKTDRRATALSLLLSGLALAALYAAHGALFFDPALPLPRDSYQHHLPAFRYLVQHVREMGGMPEWLYSYSGGVWAETYTHLFLFPYRIPALLLALVTDLSPELLYKISFCLTGIPVFLLGVWWLAVRTLGNPWYGLLAVAMALTGGLVTGVLHQEQAFATIWLSPYIWLVALSLVRDPRRLPLLGALIGLVCNAHYPHLQVIYYATCGGLLLAWPAARSQMGTVWRSLQGRRTRTLLWTTGAFFLSASPILFAAYEYFPQLKSSFRGQAAGIVSQSLADYAALHLQQASSLNPRDLPRLFHFLRPQHNFAGPLDDILLFVSSLLPLGVAAGLLLKGAGRFHLALMGLLLLVSLGRHGPLLPFWFQIPGFGFFRQWYHLLPWVHLHGLALCLWAIKSAFSGNMYRLRPSTSLGAFGSIAALACLGWVNPWAGVMGAFTAALALAPTYRPRSSVLAGVLILGTLAGGATTIPSQLRAVEKGGLRMLVEFGKPVVERPPSFFFRGNSRGLLANPVGVNPLEFIAANRRNLIRGLDSQGRWTPDPLPIGITKRSGVFRFTRVGKVPFPAEDLWAGQFNDGRWTWILSDGRQGKAETGPLGGIRFPVPPLDGWVTLRRQPSLWNFLIYLSLLPSLLGIGRIFAASHPRRSAPVLSPELAV